MAPGDLQEVLSVLRRPVLSEETARNLMVGLDAADDAAVYRISDDLALVETVDFFPPVVDDAWTWGAVAAANAMSDVYAMGGEVMFALAVAGFPREMDKAIVAEVFRGGAEKVAEAGGVLAGGHTVVEHEAKYGPWVPGGRPPPRVLSPGGLRAGGEEARRRLLGGVVRRARGDRGRRPRRHRLAAHGGGDLRGTVVLGAAGSGRWRARGIPRGGRRGRGDRRGADGTGATA